MPYIKQEDREKFNEIPFDGVGKIFPLREIGELCNNAGDLNFAITMILQHYIEKKGESYAVHNEIMGMLDCCAKEWYRKRVGPYENEKIEENGDL
jgi:hypothetical protein